MSGGVLPTGKPMQSSVFARARTPTDREGSPSPEDFLLCLAVRLLEQDGDFEGAVTEALEHLVDVVQVERASLFVIEADAPHTTRLHCTVRRGAPDLAPFHMDDWMRYCDAFADGGPDVVRVDDVHELGDRRALLDGQHVRAVLAVRIPLGAGLVGSLGVSMFSCPRVWTDDEHRFLRSASAIIGNGVRRAFADAQLREQHDALRKNEQSLRAILDAAPTVIYNVDRDGVILFANARSTRYGVLSPDELVGLRMADFLTGDVADAFRRDLERSFRTGESLESTLEVLTPIGSAIWFECTGVPQTGPDGSVESVLVFAHDVTERRAMEEQIRRAASVDALTGLDNRDVLVARLQEELALRRPDRLVAVMFVDLDRFKVTNDTLGHAAGDELLQAVARTLRATVRDTDVVARLGGDEFAIMLTDLRDVREAIALAERIRAAVATPLTIAGHGVIPSASVGVVLAGDSDHDGTDLLRFADAAMYQAKLRGRNRFELFDESLRSEVDARVDTETALRRALPRREFEVQYQPEVWLDTGAIAGVEALVRWHHPTRGTLPAASFIGVAEDSGLIGEIGRFVLREACRQVGGWRRAWPHLDLTLRVNVSARQLVQPKLLREIGAALDDGDLEPGALCLEITEHVLTAATANVVQMLRWIRDLGVRIAIDDFGTGYSSFGNLEQFPVDSIKIDRSFVSGLGVEPKNTAIIRTLVSLAAALELDVVAEGIETRRQHELLSSLGCRRGQGFLFAPALAGADAEAVLRVGAFPAT